MKKNYKYLFYLFFICFFFGMNSVKADEFMFAAFNSSAKEVKGNIRYFSTALNTGSAIQCSIVVVGDDPTNIYCRYTVASDYVTGMQYSFKPTGNYMVFSNSRGKNNTLRITEFESDCEPPEKGSNTAICSIKKVVFKWESNNQCNTPSRTGGPKGLSGIAACTGGISIFCDEYQDLTDDQVKTKCPGAYKSNNSTTANDVKKMCEILDIVAFDRWCKYADGQNIGGSEVEGVKEWANAGRSESESGIEGETPSCSALLATKTGEKTSIADFIKGLVIVISIVGIVILIVSTSGDFIKAITSGEADKMSDTFKKFKNRIIALIVLLLLPILVNWIINVLNNYLIVDYNGNIRIGNVSDCEIIK